MSTPLEVCIDTVAGLTACTIGGADRIELCSALSLGGLTPSLGLMELASQIEIPAHVMIRPSAGGFILHALQIDQMKRDIEAAQRLGLAGVVIGALTDQGRLDLETMSALMAAAKGMEITLHRAFDLTADPKQALDAAIDLGVDRILTSGGAQKAPDGMKQLAELKARAGDRIKIAAGSGLSAQNVGNLIEITGVDEVHASCARVKPAAPEVVQMGFSPARIRQTDAQMIRDMKAAIRKANR